MTEKLKMEQDPMSPVIEMIKQVCPNAVGGDGIVDFDVLKSMLSDRVVEGKRERYEFDWVGKQNAIREYKRKIRKTLRPVESESKDWANTQNLYIEGDNLDALKLLQKSYLHKVKMIYIDPPYNTGNDFVYCDDFADSCKDYLDKKEVCDADGNRLFVNKQDNGQYHSNWCNMMYPRLKLAKDLLSDDGVILISIDEYEIGNLIKICNEIFGENSFVENFIWIKNSTKNLSKTTSTNHEYIICYCKNKTILEKKELFRKEKPGLKEVKAILEKANLNSWSINDTQIALKNFYKNNPDLKGISMYDRVEQRLISGQKYYLAYTLSDCSAPKSTGKAATYEIIHPITGRPCKTPTRGWAFTRSTMDELISNNMIEFYDDENHVPRVKRFLETVETEVVKSTFEDFTDGKKELKRLFDESPFDNPKPTTVLTRFFKLLEKDSIILDFFSGSATTAHAVIQLNAEDGGHRKFIMVQLPEVCDEKSEAFKAGYKTIAEIGKERIRRAGDKIVAETGKTDLDIGFRVLRVDSTNMKDVYYKPSDTTQSGLLDLVDNIKDDRSDLDLLFGVMIEYGLPLLDKPIETKTFDGKKYYKVDDLIACFENNLSEDLIREIAQQQPICAVFKDSSFAEAKDKVNVSEIFKNFCGDDKCLKIL